VLTYGRALFICSNIQEPFQTRDLGFGEEHRHEFFLRSCLQIFSYKSSMLMKLSMMYTLKKKKAKVIRISFNTNIIFLFSFNSRSTVCCHPTLTMCRESVHTQTHKSSRVFKFFLQKPSIPCITGKVSRILSIRGRNLLLSTLTNQCHHEG